MDLDSCPVWIPIAFMGEVPIHFWWCASLDRTTAWDRLIAVFCPIDPELAHLTRQRRIARLRRKGFSLVRGSIVLDPLSVPAEKT